MGTATSMLLYQRMWSSKLGQRFHHNVTMDLPTTLCLCCGHSLFQQLARATFSIHMSTTNRSTWVSRHVTQVVWIIGDAGISKASAFLDLCLFPIALMRRE